MAPISMVGCFTVVMEGLLISDRRSLPPARHQANPGGVTSRRSPAIGLTKLARADCAAGKAIAPGVTVVDAEFRFGTAASRERTLHRERTKAGGRWNRVDFMVRIGLQRPPEIESFLAGLGRWLADRRLFGPAWRDQADSSRRTQSGGPGTTTLPCGYWGKKRPFVVSFSFLREGSGLFDAGDRLA